MTKKTSNAFVFNFNNVLIEKQWNGYMDRPFINLLLTVTKT